jgi:hypothetical protein
MADQPNPAQEQISRLAFSALFKQPETRTLPEHNALRYALGLPLAADKPGRAVERLH